MDAGADICAPQLLDELVTIDRQPLQAELDDVEMPRMLHLCAGYWGADRRFISEGIGKPLCHGTALLVKSVTLLKLFDAHRGSYVRHVVLETWKQNVVTPRSFGGVSLPCVFADAVEAHHPYAFRVLIIVGGDHSSLARGDRLGSVEGEAGNVAKSADYLPAIFCGERMRGIFNHSQIMTVRETADLVHLTWVTGKMNGDDGPGPGSNCRLNARHIDIQRRGAAVYEKPV